MLDVTTTITINGSEGDRFLSSLTGYDAPMPRALRWLATSQLRSIEVDCDDADLIARFVDELLGSGWIEVDAPPLLYSPRVGDHVALMVDVLAEIGRESAGLPPTWQFVPAGLHGKLVGWRDREDDSRAIVDIYGAERRLIVYVGADRITRVQAPVMQPVRRRRRAG